MSGAVPQVRMGSHRCGDSKIQENWLGFQKVPRRRWDLAGISKELGRDMPFIVFLPAPQ